MIAMKNENLSQALFYLLEGTPAKMPLCLPENIPL